MRADTSYHNQPGLPLDLGELVKVKSTGEIGLVVAVRKRAARIEIGRCQGDYPYSQLQQLTNIRYELNIEY